MTKVFCSEAIFRIVDRSLQILGGTGITSDTVVERIFRDVRAFRIYGPSEVHRHALGRREVKGEQAREEWDKGVLRDRHAASPTSVTAAPARG